MICHICKKDLPKDAFSPGLLKYSTPSKHICRSCQNERIKKYQRNNPDKRKAYDMAYEKKRKERRLAKQAITTAIKYRGFKPQPCQVCGEKDGVQGHHLSYLEKDWLTVIWLCPVCHKAAHHGKIDVSSLERYTAEPVAGRWGCCADMNYAERRDFCTGKV